MVRCDCVIKELARVEISFSVENVRTMSNLNSRPTRKLFKGETHPSSH